jgi:hypothetical protein
MEFAEALKHRVPLQVRLPDPKRPLETLVRFVAEVFLVQTRHGPAVAWLDPFWWEGPRGERCHIAYATPKPATRPGRWIDNEPKYGPRCLVYQKPFVMEQVDRESPVWRDCKAWQTWREGKSEQCGRHAAWEYLKDLFADLGLSRAD